MTRPTDEKVVDLFARAGVAAAQEDVLPEAFEELAARLRRRGFSTVSYDVSGLAERLADIRAGRVNGSPVPNPHKPLNPQPRPQPKTPPPPPPSKPGR